MGIKFDRIINYIRHKCRWSIWKYQLKCLSIEDYLIISTENNNKIEGTILIIAPHADDELIGCNQLISNPDLEVTIFYCGFLGSNNDAKNGIEREKEIRTYANSQNRRLVVSSPENAENDLERVIAEIQPTVVFLPSFIDWHPEHRHVNVILANVVGKVGIHCEIGWYHVSLPIPAAFVNYMSMMSKNQYLKKWRAMTRYYPSQLHMDIKRFKFIERQVINSCYAAETYYLQNVERWKNSLDILHSNENQMDTLKSTLGQIDKMYNQTLILYKTIL